MVKGVEETAASIVKTYSTDKKKKAGRQLKNAIKGLDVDNNQVDFWEVLKARAMVLKNPGAAQKMLIRLRKRHAAAQKKQSKRRKG